MKKTALVKAELDALFEKALADGLVDQDKIDDLRPWAALELNKGGLKYEVKTEGERMVHLSLEIGGSTVGFF